MKQSDEKAKLSPFPFPSELVEHFKAIFSHIFSRFPDWWCLLCLPAGHPVAAQQGDVLDLTVVAEDLPLRLRLQLKTALGQAGDWHQQQQQQHHTATISLSELHCQNFTATASLSRIHLPRL